MNPITYSDIQDAWAQVARIRERSGDRAGAERARRIRAILAHGVRSRVGQKHNAFLSSRSGDKTWLRYGDR